MSPWVGGGVDRSLGWWGRGTFLSKDASEVKSDLLTLKQGLSLQKRGCVSGPTGKMLLEDLLPLGSP